MTDYISAHLRRTVHDRAHGRCEYCRIHIDHVVLPHEPDHVIAIKHGGTTTADHLALACFLCNRFKGSDIASIDPETDQVVRLFHPRRDRWSDHFQLVADGHIQPLTNVRRATARLLQFNLPESVLTRRELILRNLYHI